MNPYNAREPHRDPLNVTKALIALVTLVITINQLTLRLPRLFSSEDVQPLSSAVIASGLIGVLLGAVVGVLTRETARVHLGAGYLVAALLAQIWPWLYWISFDGRIASDALIAVLPCTGATILSALATWTVADMLERVTPDALVRSAISPLRIVAAVSHLFLLSVLQGFTGTLLYGSLLAAIFILLAASLIFSRLPRIVSLRERWVAALLVGAVTVTTAANANRAHRTLPPAVVRSSTYRVVHYSTGQARDLRITSGQGAFQVFVGNRLRFTTLDQNRWARALTAPALQRLTCPKNALVFSQGEGLVERELLESSCMGSIVSVVRERLAVNAGLRQSWWRKVINDAWHADRVRVIERDPAVWLTEAPPSTFDLIVVDLPDPENFVDVKYYTRYFYRRIRQRLATRGLLVTQATSALRTPRTFASIRATLESAGYATLPYHTELTTLGDWYFLLASPSTMPDAAKSTGAETYSFVIPPDALAPAKGPLNRLEDPAALEAFLDETGEEFPRLDDTY